MYVAGGSQTKILTNLLSFHAYGRIIKKKSPTAVFAQLTAQLDKALMDFFEDFKEICKKHKISAEHMQRATLDKTYIPSVHSARQNSNFVTDMRSLAKQIDSSLKNFAKKGKQLKNKKLGSNQTTPHSFRRLFWQFNAVVLSSIYKIIKEDKEDRMRAAETK